MMRKVDLPLDQTASSEQLEAAVTQESRRQHLTRLFGCIVAAALPAIASPTASARGRGGRGGRRRGGRGGGRRRGQRGGGRPGPRGPGRAGNRQIMQFMAQCRQQFQMCALRARQGIGGMMGPGPGVGP